MTKPFRIFRSKFICFNFLFLLAAGPIYSQQGKLFIIGGGERTEALVIRLIQTAALQSKDHIAVLPMSSEVPDSSFYFIKTDLEKACSNKIAFLNFSANKKPDSLLLDSLRKAKLIFITGGDQSRFMNVVGHGPIYEAIHYAYRHGSTIAGTSAGAALMSREMITGNERGNSTYHETIGKLVFNNIEIREGLGLLDSVIIDQHFIVRSRYNRLLSAMADHPGFLGIGIDEGTAIIVNQGNIGVAGVGQVLVFSPIQKKSGSDSGLVKFKDIRLSVFVEGESFRTK